MVKGIQRTMTPEALKMVAARFKVLAEPLRLRILHELENGEMSVSEVAEAVGATQPNVSKHLKMLQDAGLLERQHLFLCRIIDIFAENTCGAADGAHDVAQIMRGGAGKEQPRTIDLLEARVGLLQLGIRLRQRTIGFLQFLTVVAGFHHPSFP